MSNQHLKVRKGLTLTPQSTAPTNPTEGDMYFDAIIGLRLYKNGVWQTAGGQGEVKVALVDRVTTVLPTVAPFAIDGVNVADGEKVLFTNLTVNNNRVYTAAVVGITVSWSPQPDFSGQFDPTQADVVRVVKGTVYCKSQFIYQGTQWLWGKIDVDNGYLGSAAEPWDIAYIDNLIGTSINITTSVTDGNAIISGTEKVLISTTGGLDVTVGTTSIKDLKLNGATSGDIDILVPAVVTSYNITLPSVVGTAGQFLSASDGVGTLAWEDPILGFNAWTVINSNTVATPFDDFGVETGAGTVDVTLPATPANGARVRIIDRNGDFATNSCFIKTTDSSTIEGQLQPLEIDVAFVWAEFVYDSAANNWAIYGPLAKGEQLTLQDSYAGDPVNNPVQITTTIAQGDLSVTGTERFRVSAAKGVRIRSNTPSGKVLEVENPDTTAENTSITTANASNTNPALEIRHTNPAAQSILIKGATSGSVGVMVPAVITDYDLVLPNAIGTTGQFLALDGSGDLQWTTIAAPAIVTLHDAYKNDSDGGGATITTDSTDGNLIIAGTEALSITAAGGLTVTQTAASNAVDVNFTGTSGHAVNLLFNAATNNGSAIEIVHTGAAGGKGIDIAMNGGSGGSDGIRIDGQTGYLGAGLEVNLPSGNSNFAINTFHGGTGGGADLDNTSSSVATARLRNRNSTGPVFDLLGATSGTLGLRVANAVTSHDLILPSAQGAANTFLKNDGSGNLNWAGTALGDPINSAIAKGVFYGGTAGVLAQDGDLNWDSTNKRLGIGTGLPTSSLHINDTNTTQHAVTIVANSITSGSKSAISATMNNASGHSALQLASTGSYGMHISGAPSNGMWIQGATFRGAYIQNSNAGQAAVEAKNNNASGPILKLVNSVGEYIQLKVTGGTTNYDLTLPSAQGAANTFLKNDGSGNLNWARTGYIVSQKTTTYTAVNLDKILADTATVGAFTINLPATPSIGDSVMIIDGAGNFGTATLTVGRNGENIQGAAANFTLNTNNIWAEFVYNGGSRGWEVRI